MIVTFTEVITPAEHQAIVQRLESGRFVDGRATAGKALAETKNNHQLALDDPAYRFISDTVLGALRRNDEFRAAVYPKQLHSLLVGRYQPGMTYGFHVDNALMGNDPLWRSDLSMTLFISDPSDYDGGELAMESGSGEQHFKLPARAMICYPSTTLHQVRPITRGVRLVVVAWLQSLIRDPGQREILYDLDRARRAVFQTSGKCRAFDLLTKSHANLMRRWVEN